MTTRLDALAFGEFYHVYNRGVDKRTVFQDELDYERFVALLFLSNMADAVNIRDIRKIHDSVFEYERTEPIVHIGAYCLMSNHFHILLTPAVENGIQTFMLKVQTGYSMFFNKRNARTGALFEGRFKSRHVKTDEYLKYLFSYIHLNPVKHIQSDWKEVGIRDLERTKKYLHDYQFSSLPDYSGDRIESSILKKEKFPEYFASKTEIDAELLEWLTYRPLIADYIQTKESNEEYF